MPQEQAPIPRTQGLFEHRRSVTAQRTHVEPSDDIPAGDGIQLVQQFSRPRRRIPVDGVEMHPSVEHVAEPPDAIDH